MPAKLPLRFYLQDTLTVASALIGKHLVHEHEGLRQVGRIVETEAYLGPEDLAAHTAGGRRTPRNESMWGPGGRAYVYLIYGMHHCLNVVTGPAQLPHAVLIRAVEPLSNIDQKTNGPGLLCRSMGITRALDGVDLRGPQLYITHATRAAAVPQIECSPRIGIDYAGAWAHKPWRFFDATSRSVSKRR